MQPDSTIGTVPGLAPVVDDLSIFVVPGQISSAADAITQGVAAERLGFSGVWICERIESLKEMGPILGGVAAVTSRLGIGSAPTVPAARLPLVTASLGNTLQSLSSGRFTMGVGRGPLSSYFSGWGYSQPSFATLVDYCDIIRRLWRGEIVDYDGPAGTYSGLQLHDLAEGPPPKIIFCHNGGPKASKLAANPVFDGVMPGNFLTPEAVHHSLTLTRDECERIGRDPDELSYIVVVPSAPELPDVEVQGYIGARIVFALAIWGQYYVELNHWDAGVVKEVLNHPALSDMSRAIDQTFNSPTGRTQLLDVVRLVPDSYARETCAVGPLSDCVKLLKDFKDAGADELLLYTTSPAQNAGLLEAWRALRSG